MAPEPPVVPALATRPAHMGRARTPATAVAAATMSHALATPTREERISGLGLPAGPDMATRVAPTAAVMMMITAAEASVETIQRE